MVNGRQHERSWVVDHRMMSSSIAPTSTKAASGRNSRKNFVSSSKPSSNHPSMPPAGHGSTSVSTSGPVSFASIKMRRQSAAAQAHVDRRTTATTGFQGGSQERLVDSFVTAPTGNADFNGLSQMSQESWPASANSFSSANGGYQLGQKSFSLSQSSGKAFELSALMKWPYLTSQLRALVSVLQEDPFRRLGRKPLPRTAETVRSFVPPMRCALISCRNVALSPFTEPLPVRCSQDQTPRRKSCLRLLLCLVVHPTTTAFLRYLSVLKFSPTVSTPSRILVLLPPME